MKGNVVSVLLWGRKVCSIRWDGGYQKGFGRVGSVVSFERGFSESGYDISPLEYSMRDPFVIRGLAIPCHENAYEGLPAFLSDSLPDDWGNEVFNRWMERHHLRSKDISPVDKLTFIGKRGMGAFEFEPAVKGSDSPDSIELESLYALAMEIQEKRESEELNVGQNPGIEELMRVGTSAGGQHPKAIVAYNRKTGEIKSGQILLPDDFNQCIIKFNDSGNWPASEIEYAYFLMARDCGIDMTVSELIEAGGRNHFLTERFDRREGDKILTSTAYAIGGRMTDYSELFYISRQLRLSSDEMTQLYRRMVFNYLAGNADDHDKNFSFMMGRDGVWHLAPAYDVTFTIDLTNRFFGDKHAMAIYGKRSGIVKADLLDFARRNDISGAADIVESVADTVEHFPHFAEAAKVPDRISAIIRDAISAI